MRSNKALAAEAEELAEMLGIDVETEGLGNADLVALVKRLSDQVEGGGASDEDTEGEVAIAVEVAPAVAPKASAAATKPSGYVVAKGRSVTSLRGVLGAGASCSARDFHGGSDSITRLVRLGAIEAARA